MKLRFWSSLKTRFLRKSTRQARQQELSEKNDEILEHDSRLLLLRTLKMVDDLDETIHECCEENDIVSVEEMEKLKLDHRFLLFKIRKDQLKPFYYPTTAILESCDFDENMFFNVESVVKVPQVKKLVIVVDASR